MEKTVGSELHSERQHAAARALDETVHAQLSKLSLGLSPIAVALAYADWALHLAAAPGRQMLLAQHGMALSQQAMINTLQPGAGLQGDPVPESDPRFGDPSWRLWPFNALKEGFKAADSWWREATKVDGVSSHNRHMVDFFNRQALDALAPSNWALTNPEVLKTGHESMGQSWVKGFQSYTQDLLDYRHEPDGSDAELLKPLAFKVGRDVALTPGKVVFRNRLIELIRYSPMTAVVHPEPLLIVASCIMKYYILDLSPANSMVRYLVDQGFTVFVISWRNPDASDRDLGMQDYLQMGVMEAMAAVKDDTGAPRIHALGYCLGGTFLAIVAAALGRRDAHFARRRGKAQRRRHEDMMDLDKLPELASVILLAAQTDFSEPGELGVFIDEDQLNTLRHAMARTGYLSGRQMAGSFQFLNSRDLVWSRGTRRYLLGQDDVGNDMMSWNADHTRLPERMHNEYLSSLFLNNALASGSYRVAGVGVSLMDIHAPMLVVGTVRDHVSPWRSVYKIRQLTDTDMTFILASGGHNAGIVSEPGHANRSYQIERIERGHESSEPDQWQASVPVCQGSWWGAMRDWLQTHSGEPVPPPPLDPARVLEDAPGSYVQVRYAD